MELEQAKEVRRRTHLAAQGKAACTACGNVGDIDEMVVVAYRGNVMLALHPDCITREGLRVYRDGDNLAAALAKAERKSDLLLNPGDLNRYRAQLANPTMRRFPIEGDA